MTVIVIMAVTINVIFFATLPENRRHDQAHDPSNHRHDHDSFDSSSSSSNIHSKTTKRATKAFQLRRPINATSLNAYSGTSNSPTSSNSSDNNNQYHQQQQHQQRMISTFQDAGVTLTDQELHELPTWEDMARVVGLDGPRIHNLQSCSTYRTLIPAVERNIGCSGMFNSGTNLVTQLLKANCVIPERVEKYGWEGPFRDVVGKSIGPGEAHGIRWQVPWGKHMPANFREEHATKWAKTIWKESVLAVVTIRHPHQWFRSMCKNSYTARWPHSERSCPNLREEDEDGNGGDPSPLVPLEVKYDGTVVHHDSLAHLWNDWYAQYLQKANFPYIVVRFEDLQFYAKNVTYQICACAGGEIRQDRPFRYIVDSAKDGPGHGKKEERTGMLAAWKKYGKPMPPQNGFSSLDYTTAVEHLNSEFMNLFGYQHPDPIVAE